MSTSVTKICHQLDGYQDYCVEQISSVDFTFIKKKKLQIIN